MRKFIMLFALLMSLLVVLPVFSYAQGKEQDICDYVCKQKQVAKAKCIVYEDNCVIAIQPKDLGNKTEYLKFKEQLKTNVMKNFAIKNVVVTRSPKAMHVIDKLLQLPEKERADKVKNFVQFFLEHTPTHPIAPQPR